jgi:hypothetical protein
MSIIWTVIRHKTKRTRTIENEIVAKLLGNGRRKI